MLDWRDLSLLSVFATVVRTGSFTAAARELGLAKSVVSERVRTLEGHCGVRLLERSTRRLRLTQVGEHVLEVAATVLHATQDVARIVEEHRNVPVGRLRISTTHDLGPRFVAPVAARLAATHRGLYVEVVGDDARHDLIAGGFDVGVRLGEPRSSTYGLRRLGVVSEIIVAAPALARTHAHAARPSDLAGAPWTRHALLPRARLVTFTGPRSEIERVAVDVRAEANTGDGLRGLVLGGAGFGVLPVHLAASDLKSGTLVHVCDGWTGMRVSIFAVLPSSNRPPARVALFLAALKEAIDAERISIGPRPA